MRKSTLRRLASITAGMLVLAGCLPTASLPTANLPTTQPMATATMAAGEANPTNPASNDQPGAPSPTQAPGTAPTIQPTVPETPVNTPTVIPGQNKPTVTPIVVTQPSDFWVVYLKQHQLATISGTSSNVSLLTNTPAFDYRPTWSPDGKTLAFIRLRADDHLNGQLMVMDSGSTLIQSLDSVNRYEYFTWIPNSLRIAAVRGYMGAFDVMLLDKSGTAPVQAAKDVSEYPVPSPDGKYLAMLITTGPPCDNKGCTSPNDVYLYDLTAQKLNRLTKDAQPKAGLFWSPDSAKIAYRAAETDIQYVEIVQVDGTPAGSKVSAPWWTNPWVRSPDGQSIAYYTNNNPDAKIFVIPAAGGEPRQVAALSKMSTGESAFIDTLRWQPSGKGLIFNLWIEVYAINLDGSGLRKLPVTLENIFFDVRPVATHYAPPPAPTPVASMVVCADAPATRVNIGRKASVSTDPPAPNNVRESPMKTSKLLGQIQPGEKVEILDGPMCGEKRVWWQVRSLASGLTGWTAEGDAKEYWLVPLP